MAAQPDPAVSYPPLDTLKPVADGIWIVDSGPVRPMGLHLPVRMTVIRLGSGEVWLHSPTRLDDALLREVERIGPVRHLVAPNIAHWIFLKEWQHRLPDAMTWAVPELRRRSAVRISGVRLDRDLEAEPPGAWAGDIDQTIIPGAGGFREVAFFHKTSRTLVLTDLIANLEAAKLPLASRAFARLAGMLGPDGRAPAYVRLLVRLRRNEAQRAATQLVGWSPDRIIFAHGRWFERDGTGALKRSLSWLLE